MKQFFFVALLFFVHILSSNWQSYGNFSALQLTQINSLVTNYKTLIVGGKTTILSAQEMSNTLNTKFEMAWNVFVVKMNKLYYVTDGILNGYAFR